MTFTNPGNFHSTRLKLRMDYSSLENKGWIYPRDISPSLTFSRQGGCLPPCQCLGLTPQQSAHSHHTESHPLVAYVLSNFSLQIVLLLDQVVIAVNCSSVSLPSVQSLSSLFSLWKGRQSFVLFFKDTWCHFFFLKSCPDDQNNARILYMVLNHIYTFSNILKTIRFSLLTFIKVLKKKWSELTSSCTDCKMCTWEKYRFKKLN